MSEETQPVAQEQAAPKEEVVQVSEQEMDQLNNEIQKVEDSKIDAAKQEGYQAAKTDAKLEDLQKELAAIKEANAKRAEEEERNKILAEIEAEKAKAEQVQRKHVIPESNNPAQVQQPEAPKEAPMSNEEAWAKFEQATREGRFSASLK